MPADVDELVAALQPRATGPRSTSWCAAPTPTPTRWRSGSPGTRRTHATWSRSPTCGPTGACPSASGATPSSRPGSTASPPTAPPPTWAGAPATATRSSTTSCPSPTCPRRRPRGRRSTRRPCGPSSPTRCAGCPPQLRAVVVLRDVYDLPHEAIAAELGISVSAAKVRLHRARRSSVRTSSRCPASPDRGRRRRSRRGVPVRCDAAQPTPCPASADGSVTLDRAGRAHVEHVPALPGRAGAATAAAALAARPADRVCSTRPGPAHRHPGGARRGGDAASATGPAPAAAPPTWAASPRPPRRARRRRHRARQPGAPPPSAGRLTAPARRSPLEEPSGAVC